MRSSRLRSVGETQSSLTRYAIDLQAGIYNITGLTLYDLDRKTESKIYFEKALALDSNFVLARQNLDALNTIESGANKVNPGNNTNQTSPAKKQD